MRKLIFLILILFPTSFPNVKPINFQIIISLNRVVASINEISSIPTDEKKALQYFQLFKLVKLIDIRTLKSIMTNSHTATGVDIISNFNLMKKPFVNRDYIEMMNHLDDIADEDMEWVGEMKPYIVIVEPKLSIQVNKTKAINDIKTEINFFETNYEYAKKKANKENFDFKRDSDLLIKHQDIDFFIYLRSHYVTKEIDAIVDKHWSKWEIMFPELKNVPKTKRVAIE